MTAGELLYRKLRADILFAVLKPNDKLTLEPISRRYGASVPTIREVLNRLVSESLVVAEGQKGFRVAPVSIKGLKEIAHARLLLEAEAL
ncbi:MAG: GntR family transcriptional regulator, partial [Hyphomonas sp.]|uniref:GntR family transcriptional regulator n=1 Tax=Hyphomonas sp. TaxID=87 RepID=UPI00349FFDC7